MSNRFYDPLNKEIVENNLDKALLIPLKAKGMPESTYCEFPIVYKQIAVSNGELEKSLKKYYLESDASKEMIQNVINDIKKQVDEVIAIETLNAFFGEPRIIPTHEMITGRR